MKDYIYCALAVLGFCALLLFAVLYGTSDKAWYAGKHTAGCDGTDNCGCYERLVAGERAKK